MGVTWSSPAPVLPPHTYLTQASGTTETGARAWDDPPRGPCYHGAMAKGARKQWRTVGVTPAQAKQGLELEGDQSYIIRCGLPAIVVVLGIDPAEKATEDDTYTLFTSVDRSIYSKTLTPKDDGVPGDDRITLRFDGLPDDLAQDFSLEIDPGAEGQPYLAFEAVPGADLLDPAATSSPAAS